MLAGFCWTHHAFNWSIKYITSRHHIQRSARCPRGSVGRRRSWRRGQTAGGGSIPRWSTGKPQVVTRRKATGAGKKKSPYPEKCKRLSLANIIMFDGHALKIHQTNLQLGALQNGLAPDDATIFNLAGVDEDFCMSRFS